MYQERCKQEEDITLIMKGDPMIFTLKTWFFLSIVLSKQSLFAPV